MMRRAANRRPARALLRICRGESLVQTTKHAAQDFSSFGPPRETSTFQREQDRPCAQRRIQARKARANREDRTEEPAAPRSSTELSSPPVLSVASAPAHPAQSAPRALPRRAPSGSEIAKLCPAVSATMNTAIKTSAKSARTRTVVASQFPERATSIAISPFGLADFGCSSIAMCRSICQSRKRDEGGRSQEPLYCRASIALLTNLGR